MNARVAIVMMVVVGCAARSGAQPATQPGPDRGAVQQQGMSPEQALEAARQQKAAGHVRQALELLKAVLERDPNNIEARLLLGETLLDSQGEEADYTQASGHFKEVLKDEPKNFRANLGMGKINLAMRSYRQASSFLAKAEEFAPDKTRSEARRLFALALANSGERNRAVSMALKAVEADPKDLDALQALVEIRSRGAGRDPKELDQALIDAEALVKQAEAAVELTPWDTGVLGRLDAAYGLQRDVLRAYHNSLYEVDNRGQPTERLRPGKQADAAAVLMKLADTFRRRAALRFTLAKHDAIMFAQRAVEYDPRNVRYLEQLAELYERTRNPERAIETYRSILGVDPNHAGARQYLEAAGVPLTTQPTTQESPAGAGK